MFANIKQGSPLYVLQLGNEIKYHVCTVDQYRPSFSYNFNGGALVDITVMLDNVKKEFAGIQANSSVSIGPDYIITDSKEAMASQVQDLYNTKNDIVQNVDMYKSQAEQLKDLLQKINPQFAKEQAIDTLTSRVDNMQNEFVDVKQDVKRILNLLTTKTN